MKDIKAVRGRYYLARLIAEGEHERQDFKFAISDPFKIARSVSAFANHAGGRLLVGVKDNGVIAGVRNEEDIYVVEQAAGLYCRPAVPIEVKGYRDAEGATVLIVEIAPVAERPVMARDADGRWRPYIRVADENIVAHELMERVWRRQRGAEAAAMMSADGPARVLLDMIDAEGMADIADFVRRAHVSRRMADDIIVNLAAMQVIEFRYHGGAFRLFRAEQPAE